MTDIKSNVLKNILTKKLNKAKEGITQILKDKSFKAIEDYKTTFKFDRPEVQEPTVSAEPKTPEVEK